MIEGEDLLQDQADQKQLNGGSEGGDQEPSAEAELQKMERELRDTLASAKARRDGVGDNAGTAVPA